MILTCPKCATRYFVGDDQIGVTGRTVECVECAQRWRASAGEAPPVTPAPAIPAAPAEQSATPLFVARPAGRAPVKTSRSRRGWVVVVLVLAAALVSAIMFRAAVARALPWTAGVYASLGLPVGGPPAAP